MYFRHVALVIVLSAGVAHAFPQAAPDPAPSAEPESGSTTDRTVQVTASRYEELVRNAPATISVVTGETIDSAPIQSVTELIRLLPGVNTVQTSARDVNVTTRGATGTLADSMLVLLDGRSIYQDFFGIVLWDFIPIDPSEIKQIEVIRGPASAVWGANAMTGVVNVISKAPREMQGTTLSIRFGQIDRSPRGGPFEGGGLFTINSTHAQALSSRFAYKVSAGLLTQEPFLRPATGTNGTAFPAFNNRGTLQPRLDAVGDYEIAAKRRLVLAGGISGTDGIIHTGLGPLTVERGSTLKYGRLTYTRDYLKLQTFVNALDGESAGLLLTDTAGNHSRFTFEYQAYDVEASNAHVLGSRHFLSYGGNFRYNNFDLSFAPAGTSRKEGGAYIQDQFILSPLYTWIVGARIDRFSVLDDGVVSPRTAFLITPGETQRIRFSVNRAFRAPSIINNFIDTSFLTPVTLGPLGSFDLPANAVGNPALREEALTAYEVGYRGWFDNVTIGAAFYVHRSKNMIQFTQAASYTSAAPPPNWPLPAPLLDQLRLPSRFTYQNFERILDRGVELSAELRVLPGLTGFANYTWQADPEPTGFDVSELNLPPTHRVNAGVSVARGRYFGSVAASYVDSEYWQDVLPAYVGWTDPYTLVDAGFGVHSSDRLMTVAVRVRNLLNRPIQQHFFGDVIRRTVIGEVRFKFPPLRPPV